MTIYRSINALAETIFGLYKTELIRRNGPWRNLEEVEFATPEWVDWFNNRRLFGPLGNIPPAEFEALYDGLPKPRFSKPGLALTRATRDNTLLNEAGD